MRNENHYYQGSGSAGTKGGLQFEALLLAFFGAFVMLVAVAFYFTRLYVGK